MTVKFQHKLKKLCKRSWSISMTDRIAMLNSVARGWIIGAMKGDARLPIKNVGIRNVTVGEVTKFVKNVVNSENVVEGNIIYKEKQDKR